jgi:hypothetical protein
MASNGYPGHLQSIVRQTGRLCVLEPMRLMQRQQAFPGPLMRVRRKPVRRCDRHGQVEATTRPNLWGAKIFVSLDRKTARTVAAEAPWPRGHYSPELVVAEDSSVRPGWHSKSRRLVLACSASFQAPQPSHAESKETSHKMGRGRRGKLHGRNAQAMRANGESFHGYAHRWWVDSPTGRVGVMMRLCRSLEREHRLDV